jgi:hypothetical protein
MQLEKMKKNTIQIVCIIVLFSQNVHAQFARFSKVSKEDYKEAELRKKNNVSKVTTIIYLDSISYAEDENGKIDSVKEFDINGDMIKNYSKMDDKDSLYLRSKFEYDSFHRITKIIFFEENEIIQDSFIATFKDSVIYSEERFESFTSSDYCLQQFKDGSLIYEVIKKKGVTIDSSHYINNELGQHIKMEDYSRGRLNLTIEYENLTERDYIERIYEVNGTLRLKRYWKYDNDNNILERVEFNSKEVLTTWYSYKYDCNGNEIAGAVYDGPVRKLSFRDESKYESNKLKEVVNFNKENNISSRYIYHYDLNGLMVLEIYKPEDSGNVNNSEYRVFKIENRN